MIQRIQTLYLLLASVAIGLLFFFPITELLVDKQFLFFFRYRGLYELKEGAEILSISSIPLAILYSINLLLALFTIFLYKNRTLQMRMCIFNILLLIGSLGLMYYYIWIAFSDLNAVIHYTIFALMPVIAAILTFMAFRGIRKDELLVRSVDRIR
ncbi:MAG: DUF4293 domain-containing protein [Bacteroidales bacterium]|nr:DUF4293 domain-containing protein [Bacteroidales bacterium]